MYKDDPILIHGNKRGLISDGNIFPEDSVLDCSNMDFFPDYDRRREPYSLKYDGSEFLPAEYSIVGFHQYRFTNEDGSQKETIMVAGKDITDPQSPLRIWINDFYEPGENFHNGFYDTENPGWISDNNNETKWTELTEMIGINHDPSGWTIVTRSNSVTTTQNGASQYFELTGFTGEKAAIKDYTRGWFLYDENYKCIGIVKYQNPGTEAVIGIATNISYNGSNIVHEAVTFNQKLFLTRYPVTAQNIDNWINITDVSFSDNANAVQIVCGDKSRVLNLSFLENKKFFDDTLIPGGTDIGFYKKDFSGLWFSFDSLCVSKKKDYIVATSTARDIKILKIRRDPNGNAYTWLWLDIQNILNQTPLREGSTINVTGTFLGTTMWNDGPTGARIIQKIINVPGSPVNIIWVNYGFGSGTTEWQNSTASLNNASYPLNVDITTKFAIEELSEAGLMMRFVSDDITSTDKGYDEIWDCCMQLSGFQSLFIKRAIGKGNNVSVRMNLDINLYFNYHYDRRFTEIEMFYSNEKPPADLKVNYEEKFAYLLSDEFYGRTKYNGTGRYDLYNTAIFYTELNSYEKTAGSVFERSGTVDSGLSTDAYLNNRIWKDPFVSTKELIQVGKYSVAIGVQRDKVDSEKVLDGKFKISISNLQQGAIETSNCFPDERDRQISVSQPLTKGAATLGNQFLIFSERTLYACDLLDGKDGTISQSREYDYAGTYGRKTLVRAEILDQFAGVYYLSNDTIYRFLSSGPEDILVNRWKETYQAIPDEDKRNAITGYNPFTKDVFFVIKDTVYIWNIIYENWRKYTLYDLPENMTPTISGEIYWSSGQNIYYLEKRGTAYYRDQTSDDTHTKIPFLIRKRMLHTTVLKEKIPDRVGLIFESKSINGDDEYIEVAAGRNGQTNDILDSHYINIVNDPNRPDFLTEFKHSFTFGKQGESVRARAKFYDITISYVDNPGVPASLKEFMIKEYLINAKL